MLKDSFRHKLKLTMEQQLCIKNGFTESNELPLPEQNSGKIEVFIGLTQSIKSVEWKTCISRRKCLH